MLPGCSIMSWNPRQNPSAARCNSLCALVSVTSGTSELKGPCFSKTGPTAKAVPAATLHYCKHPLCTTTPYCLGKHSVWPPSCINSDLSKHCFAPGFQLKQTSACCNAGRPLSSLAPLCSHSLLCAFCDAPSVSAFLQHDSQAMTALFWPQTETSQDELGLPCSCWPPAGEVP